METETTIYSKHHPEFITVICLEWKPILEDGRFKDIIRESLLLLSKAKRITVYAFVIMQNHFHMIWRMLSDHERDAVQRDFLKYTGWYNSKPERFDTLGTVG